MTWCQRVSSCQPIGTRDANQSCEGNDLRDATGYRAVAPSAEGRLVCRYLTKHNLINSLGAEVNESARLIESTGEIPPYKILRFHRKSPLIYARLAGSDR